MSAALLARTLLDEACAAIGPPFLEERTRAALSHRIASVRPAPVRFAVVAIGKAAPAMMRGALTAIGECDGSVVDAVVATSPSVDVSRLPSSTSVILGAHPIADESSVAAGHACLKLARRTDYDVLVALISGGASAIATVSIDGVNLALERALTRRLLDAGVSVHEVNLVRRRISQLRGGGLLVAAAPRPVHTLVSCDVLLRQRDEIVAAPPWVVGSGPGSIDPSDDAQARLIVERCAPELVSKLPASFARLARPHAQAPISEDVVASPFDALAALKTAAIAHGLAIERAAATLDCVEALARADAETLRTLSPGRAVVRIGEPSVAVPIEHGSGGRATRWALGVYVEGIGAGAAVGAAATDGVDGSSGLAGAVLEGPSDPTRVEAGRHALERYDEASLLRAWQVGLEAAPSGVNLLDLHLLLRI